MHKSRKLVGYGMILSTCLATVTGFIKYNTLPLTISGPTTVMLAPEWIQNRELWNTKSCNVETYNQTLITKKKEGKKGIFQKLIEYILEQESSSEQKYKMIKKNSELELKGWSFPYWFSSNAKIKKVKV
jgi:hypothetical protein